MPLRQHMASHANLTFILIHLLCMQNGCGMIVARGGMQSCMSSQYQYANANVFGWVNGPTSRCFPITYKFSASLDGGATTYIFPSTGQQGDRDAACFPSMCDAGKLFVVVANRVLRCPPGQWPELKMHEVAYS